MYLAVVLITSLSVFGDNSGSCGTGTQNAAMDSAFNLNGIGRKEIRGDSFVFSYGELDCVVRLSLQAGAGFIATGANCKTVNNESSQMQIDAIKNADLTEPERNVMYLIRRSISSKIKTVKLPGNENLIRLHIKAIECVGPAQGNWKQYSCEVVTDYSDDDCARQPNSSPKMKSPPEPGGEAVK